MQSDQNMSKQAYKVDGCSIMRPSGFIGSSFCYATEITKQMDELSTALHEYEKERDFQRGLVDAMHIAQYGSPCPLIERLTSAIARAEAAGVVTFGCEPWEDGEYVITANKSVVGCTVARSAAPEIIRWVATAWAELIKANTAALNAAQQKGPA